MLSEAQKAEIGQEALDAAKRMADAAYAERLAELELAPHDAAEYDKHAAAVAPQVARMRVVLREHETRSMERVWLKGRPQGELDEARLVDGITGSSAIYKLRGPKPAGGAGAQRRVAMRFVMDLSGSMVCARAENHREPSTPPHAPRTPAKTATRDERAVGRLATCPQYTNLTNLTPCRVAAVHL